MQRDVDPDETRPGLVWQTLLCEKEPLGAARGLDRVQAILAQDRKVATYKLALVRALSTVGRTQAQSVRWGTGEVYVPLRPLAIAWLTSYWPLLTGPRFVAQLRGERVDSRKPIAFRRVLATLAGSFGPGGLLLLLRELDDDPTRHQQALKVIADAIRVGPVTYAGTGGPAIFRFVRRIPDGADPFGWVAVPEAIWLDLVRFDHWVEDSVVLRWAKLTAEMNPAMTAADVLPLLLATPDAERETGEVRAGLRTAAVDTALGGHLLCVWTGAALSAFEVDHLIPYAVWGNNDLWNLLPALPRVNQAKGDALPSRPLLLARREAITTYWDLYHAQLWGRRFAHQIERSLGSVPGTVGWTAAAFAGLTETVERLAMTRGLARWEP